MGRIIISGLVLLIGTLISANSVAQEEYNESEPSIVYYSLGAQINVINPFKPPSVDNISKENSIDSYNDLVEKEMELAGLAVDLFILTIFTLFIAIIYSRFSLSLLLKRLFQTRQFSSNVRTFLSLWSEQDIVRTEYEEILSLSSLPYL